MKKEDVMAESEQGFDYDVIEMELPPYEEEFSPFPEVETDFNFEEHKEDIYRRNRLIAAERQTELLREENRRKIEKQRQFKEMTELAANAKPRRKPAEGLPLRVILLVWGIMLLAVVGGQLFNEMRPKTKDEIPTKADIYEIQPELESQSLESSLTLETVTEAAVVLTDTAEQSGLSEEASEEEEVTAVEDPFVEWEENEFNEELSEVSALREPFAEDGTAYIYSTEKMSCKFTPEYTENQYGNSILCVYVTVKNLTDYDYIFVPEFFCENTGDVIRADFIRPSVNESTSWMYSFRDESEKSHMYYEFDEDGLCSFTLQFYGEEVEYFGEFLFSPKYPQNTEEKIDEGFSIPFSEILEYLNQ